MPGEVRLGGATRGVSPPLNVRVSHELKAMVMLAAEMAGESLSEFMRQALEAGARRQLAEEERRLGLVEAHVVCRHPIRRTMSMHIECAECGEVIRRFL